MAVFKKRNENKYRCGCRGKRTLTCCWCVHKMVWPLWKSVWKLLKKLKIDLSCDQMGIYLNESKLTYVRDFCSLVIKASLKTYKWWDQLGKKVWYMYTVKYFSAIEKKRVIWKKTDAVGENHTRHIKLVSETQTSCFLSFMVRSYVCVYRWHESRRNIVWSSKGG